VGIWGDSDERTKASWRLRLLLHEGIESHPRLKRDDERPELWLWLPTLTTNKPTADPRRQLIVLDEHDSASKIQRTEYLAYFKRSFVSKRDGRVVDQWGRHHHKKPRFFPFQYSIADAYYDDAPSERRPLDVVCTLRVGRGQFQARARALLAARRAMLSLNLSGYAGELDSGSRVGVNPNYFALMRQARAVVTVQPGEWEGDFRTFEAFASGALVFSDDVNPAPGTPHPFVDGLHYVRFDENDDLSEKLRFYLVERPDVGARVAARGYSHARKYHRAVTRLDWILRSALAELPPDDDDKDAPSSLLLLLEEEEEDDDTAGALLRRWLLLQRPPTSSDAPPEDNEEAPPRLNESVLADLRRPLDRRRWAPHQ